MNENDNKQDNENINQQPYSDNKSSGNQNGLCNAAYVLGIISLVLGCCMAGAPFNIIAIVLGGLGMGQTTNEENRKKAKTGFICGIVSIVVTLVAIMSCFFISFFLPMIIYALGGLMDL